MSDAAAHEILNRTQAEIDGLLKKIDEIHRRAADERITHAEAVGPETPVHKFELPADFKPWPFEVTWDFANDPKTQSTSSDVRGRISRVDGMERLECRLGCGCDRHKPPREPWVPSVDDFDLLPDA